jgi:hypothetical protein
LVKRLPLPGFNSAQAVETCAVGITVAERARVLREALPFIVPAEVAYLQRGPLGEIFKFVANPNVTPELNSELMGTIYKSHFARMGSPSRSLYEAIRQAPQFGICPLCAQRTVASVDHYLPQSLYPVFNLTPANLIPACSDCNKSKLARTAQKAEEQTLHPYFDDLGSARWLVASVEQNAPPAIIFSVRPPPHWSAVLAERAVHHFKVMGLGELYAAQAASELADISYGITEVGQAAGPEGVYAHLDSELRTRHARDPNSWKTALYEGLRDSKWFCDEGYLLVR